MITGFTCLGRFPISKQTKSLLKLIFVWVFRKEKTPSVYMLILLIILLIVDLSIIIALFSMSSRIFTTSPKIGGSLFQVELSSVIPFFLYAIVNALSMKDF